MRNHETLEKLHSLGYNICIDHYRDIDYRYEGYGDLDNRHVHRQDVTPLYFRSDVIRKQGATFSPFGGETAVQIFKDGNLVGETLARCHPQDNYNKRVGVNICLGRLLDKIGIDV